jgi:hypothetical protein
MLQKVQEKAWREKKKNSRPAAAATNNGLDEDDEAILDAPLLCRDSSNQPTNFV